MGNVPRQECSQVPRQQCESVARRVPSQRCFQIPREQCAQVQRQVEQEQCREVPRQQCRSVPRQQCSTPNAPNGPLPRPYEPQPVQIFAETKPSSSSFSSAPSQSNDDYGSPV